MGTVLCKGKMGMRMGTEQYVNIIENDITEESMASEVSNKKRDAPDAIEVHSKDVRVVLLCNV